MVGARGFEPPTSCTPSRSPQARIAYLRNCSSCMCRICRMCGGGRATLGRLLPGSGRAGEWAAERDEPGRRGERPEARQPMLHDRNAQAPHAAFAGQSPDEMYFGRGAHVPAKFAAAGAAAPRRRLKIRRAAPSPPRERRCPRTPSSPQRRRRERQSAGRAGTPPARRCVTASVTSSRTARVAPPRNGGAPLVCRPSGTFRRMSRRVAGRTGRGDGGTRRGPGVEDSSGTYRMS